MDQNSPLTAAGGFFAPLPSALGFMALSYHGIQNYDVWLVGAYIWAQVFFWPAFALSRTMPINWPRLFFRGSGVGRLCATCLFPVRIIPSVPWRLALAFGYLNVGNPGVFWGCSHIALSSNFYPRGQEDARHGRCLTTRSSGPVTRRFSRAPAARSIVRQARAAGVTCRPLNAIVRLHMNARWLFTALPSAFIACAQVHGAEDANGLCAEFRQLGWPRSYDRLSALYLEPTQRLGVRAEAVEHYYNIDVDGDDIGDPISKSCSASTTPADPCILEVQLSTGGRLSFEAWHLSVLRFHGRYYVLTTGTAANPDAEVFRIFLMGPKAPTLQCEAR